MFTESDSRREFIKKSVYVVPAVLSLNVALVEARAGSPRGPCGDGAPGQGGGGPPGCLPPGQGGGGPPGQGGQPDRGQRDTSRPSRLTR